jgi:putative ABC transport system permease protein
VGHSVAARTREIGVRMALGANRGAVRRMVLGQALRPVVLGLAAGAVTALAVTPVLSSWLYGVRAGDPLTFLAGSVLILTVAAAASALPARRATAIDPALTLRSD